ncbi:hypothetical protein VNO77_31449 [Canavalia gladiata]|uniref:Uncharacterized protein n=1 Tax=Canavalia gladiata TaxID=3824 RepID=A0AAN9Q1R8_CANGL
MHGALISESTVDLSWPASEPMPLINKTCMRLGFLLFFLQPPFLHGVSSHVQKLYMHGMPIDLTISGVGQGNALDGSAVGGLIHSPIDGSQSHLVYGGREFVALISSVSVRPKMMTGYTLMAYLIFPSWSKKMPGPKFHAAQFFLEKKNRDA